MTSSTIGFLEPLWLFMAILVPLVVLGIRSRSASRAPLQEAIRAVVLLLIVIGLARPYFVGADSREYAVFVVDLSESVDSGARQRALAALRQARRELPERVVASCISLGMRVPNDLGFERAEQWIEQWIDETDRSSLSTALSAAGTAIPRFARGSVTLVTDGRATDRRYGDALIALEERGIPVHVLELGSAPVAPHAAAIAIDRELRVGVESEFEVEVVGTPGDVTIELRSGELSLGKRTVTLGSEREVLRFRYEPRASGFLLVEAIVGDRVLRRTFAVQDALRALYVGDRIQGGREGLSALVGPGIAFDALASGAATEGAPRVDLERYDLVVIDDAPAERFAEPLASALREAVTERGLGLFVSGGESAFGAGGWSESAIAGILPVDARQSEEKRDPSTTLVIIIDTSGSMGGERIQLAKEVARLAMSRLLPHDKVGIVEFYGAKRWAAPIQPASNTIDLSRAINRMDAGGGTVILPAIEEAYYGMQNVQTRYKHVLVLTDGGVEMGSFEPLLRRMAEEGINVSTVLIGPEAHSEFLVDIANWGKGRFYSVPDRFNLPEVLFKQPTSSRLPAYRPGTFTLRTRGGSGWWGEVDPTTAPPISGYAETVARPGAEVLIEIEESHAPLLATWNHGLGRVTAFTSEPNGAGTRSWKEWTGHGPLLARALERTALDRRSPYDFALERHDVEIELIARRRFATTDLPRAQWIDEDGRALAELAFERQADGYFVARQIVSPERSVRVVASTTASDPPQVRRALDPFSDERGEDSVTAKGSLELSEVARASGGERLSFERLATEAPRSGGSSSARRVRDLSSVAFLAALLIYLFEIFHRRRDRSARGVA